MTEFGCRTPSMKMRASAQGSKTAKVRDHESCLFIFIVDEYHGIDLMFERTHGLFNQKCWEHAHRNARRAYWFAAFGPPDVGEPSRWHPEAINIYLGATK